MELCGYQTSTVACCISAEHYAAACSINIDSDITTSNGRMSVSARHKLQVDLKLLDMRLDLYVKCSYGHYYVHISRSHAF